MVGESSDVLERINARIKNKKKARQKILLKIVFTVLVLSLISTSLVWWMLYSPMFKVMKVDIQQYDQNYQTFVDINKINTITSSITSQHPKSMIFFDTRNLEEQLKEVHGVENAFVTKKWTNQIEIQIVAKKPEAIIGDKIVDRDAYELASSDLAKPKNAYKEIKASDLEVKKECIKLLMFLNRNKFDFQYIQAASSNGIEVFLKGEKRVVFGNASELSQKLNVVKALLTNDATKNKIVFDVSSPKFSAVK